MRGTYVDPQAEMSSLAPLNGSTPVADPSQLLENIPCGSGNGNYWIRPVSSVTHHETAGSPTVIMDGTSCGGGIDGNAMFAPGQPSMNAQYVHWDHLGSTRLLTDEFGVQIAAFKYYPFGYEAEFSGGNELRQKFTGHERDEAVGLDYMMARSCRMSLGRFLEPDPYDGSIRPAAPQSWNRYAYVLNDPVNGRDPDGYDTMDNKTNFSGGAASQNNGPVTVDRTQPDNSVKKPTVCDPSVPVPKDPANPSQTIEKNPVVAKALADATIKTENGRAVSGTAEAGGTIESKNGVLTAGNQVDSVHSGKNPAAELLITKDINSIFGYHVHGNERDPTPSAQDASWKIPMIVGSHSLSQVYVTIPGRNCYIQLVP